MEPEKASSGKLLAILSTAFVAGTLDIFGAILLHCFILSNAPVMVVLQAISSAVFGKSAFKGGWEMAMGGLSFHFIIALAFTTVYYYTFPYISFFRTQKIISGLIYGAFTWVVMNLLVLPLSRFSQPPLQLLPSIPGIIVLMLLFGLPIALMAARYYDRANPANVSQVYALH
jgi:uncharacterized membrane protein YagU involved in acid resistance